MNTLKVSWSLVCKWNKQWTSETDLCISTTEYHSDSNINQISRSHSALVFPHIYHSHHSDLKIILGWVKFHPLPNHLYHSSRNWRLSILFYMFVQTLKNWAWRAWNKGGEDIRSININLHCTSPPFKDKTWGVGQKREWESFVLFNSFVFSCDWGLNLL